MITTLRRVEAGTDGAVTRWVLRGSVAGVAAAALVVGAGSLHGRAWDGSLYWCLGGLRRTFLR